MSDLLYNLAQQLIQKKSVTPANDGAIELVADFLTKLGFKCNILDFAEANYPNVRNLYAKYGNSTKNLAFAGHTDVVPTGDGWKYPPFAAMIDNGNLYGRGAVDMKGAIAAYMIATQEFLQENPNFKHSLSFIITGDEEDIAINGTVKILDWLKDKVSHTIVGEPTNPNKVGEMIKIGRRGSVNFTITSIGKQGHVAYPENAINPVANMIKLLDFLNNHKFDRGNEFFDPTHLEVTDFNVNNNTSNIIPNDCSARLNIRFNNEQTGENLVKFIKESCGKYLHQHKLDYRISGEAFFNRDSYFTDLIANSIKSITGKEPVRSTSGGTSDARFIKNICPVVECGLINKTAHQIDEHISLEELLKLKNIYKEIIENYFKI